jgi:hypothetical protein
MLRFQPQLEELENRLVPSVAHNQLPVSVSAPPDGPPPVVQVINFQANDAAAVAAPDGITVGEPAHRQ